MNSNIWGKLPLEIVLKILEYIIPDLIKKCFIDNDVLSSEIKNNLLLFNYKSLYHNYKDLFLNFDFIPIRYVITLCFKYLRTKLYWWFGVYNNIFKNNKIKYKYYYQNNYYFIEIISDHIYEKDYRSRMVNLNINTVFKIKYNKNNIEFTHNMYNNDNNNDGSYAYYEDEKYNMTECYNDINRIIFKLLEKEYIKIFDYFIEDENFNIFLKNDFIGRSIYSGGINYDSIFLFYMNNSMYIIPIYVVNYYLYIYYN